MKHSATIKKATINITKKEGRTTMIKSENVRSLDTMTISKKESNDYSWKREKQGKAHNPMINNATNTLYATNAFLREGGTIEQIETIKQSYKNIVLAKDETIEPIDRTMNYTDEILKFSCSDLLKLTNKELIRLCVRFDLKKSGKKSELVHTLSEYMSVHDIFSDDTVFDEKTLCEYIANNHINERIAYSIVKRIAGNPKHMCNVSCTNIVNSFYNDSLFDDICQCVYIAMHILVHEGHLHYDKLSHRLVFDKYTTESGIEKSYYINLYNAVQKCIDSYRGTTKAMAYDTTFNKVSLTIGDYKQQLLIDIINEKSGLVDFMRNLKLWDSKNYSDYCTIISCLFDGVNYDNIATKCGTNERSIKYKVSKLRNYAIRYFKISDVTSDCTYYKYKSGGKAIVTLKNGVYVDKLTGTKIDLSGMYVTKKGTEPKLYRYSYRVAKVC